MRADDLVILLEVARAGTLSGAAKVLGLNHTTVARRLHQLERDVGAAVLSSGANGTYLTERGRALLKSAEQIERSLAEASSSGDPEDLTGLVRISGPEAFCACIVAPAIARVQRRHPRLAIEVTTATRPLLQGSSADIEIGLARSAARRTGVLELSDYTLGLYGSRDYLQRRGTPSSTADLRHHGLIYYIEGLMQVEDLSLPLPHPITTGSPSVHFQLAATRNGAGLGLLPDFLARQQPELAQVLAGQVRLTRTFVAALAPAPLRRSGTRAVLRAIRSEIASRQDQLLPSADGAVPGPTS
ncbi:LysR family transcriptional regulator [Luteococcus sp. OSA5]|uniref:LysR family transcriptional regulator n=1 Tax=Luteococcus sp. OSA5 TaxID=3401630 RepID=UPI003B428F7E